MTEGEKPSQKEKENAVDWLEVRRQTLHDLLPIIDQLAHDKVEIEKRWSQGEEKREEKTYEQVTLVTVFNWLVRANHLTVAGQSCCNEQHNAVGRNLAGFSSLEPGDIIEYEEGAYEVVQPTFKEPKQGEWVYVTQPFIADNLLREVLQHVAVRPAHEEEILKHLEENGPLE